MTLARNLSLIVLACLQYGPALAGDIFIGLADQEAVVLSNVAEGADYALLVKAPPEPAAPESADTDPPRKEIRVAAAVVERAAAYAPLVDEAARETRLDPRLLHAVIATESGYNPVARSAKGAQGLMQLMPATARRYGVANAYEPRNNIMGGARYLADLLAMFDQDVQLALAAYNAGEQAVIRHGRRIPPYRETSVYVPRVLDYYRAFSKHSL
jgi:soluble lytic murein transglycosylase-like protein